MLVVVDASAPIDAAADESAGNPRMYFTTPMLEIDNCDRQGSVMVLVQDGSVWFRDMSGNFTQQLLIFSLFH